MRRILYFLATNFAIIFVLGIVLSLIGPFLPPELRSGIGGNFVFAAVFGFGGAFISLWMSKGAAKRAAGVQIITNPSNSQERWLVETVARQAEAAGIGMPEVGIFPSPQPNAFATGAKRNDSLVAVSVGLLNNMTQDEVEAVLGHEIAHVANGDMVTMTLLQGVMNTFVFFFARLVAQAIDRDGRGMGYFMTYMLMQSVFGFLASIVTAKFSRAREYRADAGGAALAGKEKMIAALERLKQGQAGELPNQLAAFGISSGAKKLFSTHPALDDRIAALRSMDNNELGEFAELDSGTVVRN
ncbi:MAG: protease HtpX [Arenicella sp.]